MERLAGRVILLWGWRRAAAAFAAGAAGVLAQAPYDFFAICFISFPVLVWLLDGSNGEPGQGLLRRLWPSFATGWWFGFGYFVAGLWWIGQALLVEAEAHAWALPLAIVVLPAGLALFYGLAAAIARLAWADDLGRILALAAGFGIAEWLRGSLFTGFPWNAIGYAAMPVPLLMQSSAAIGLYGVNALAVAVFAMPALAGGNRYRRTGLALAAMLVALHAGFGWWRLSLPETRVENQVSLRIVQPSIDQGAKWDDAERIRILDTYLDLSARPPEGDAKRPDLVIWPETAVPYLITERPEVLSAIGAMLQDGQALLTGAVRSEGDPSGGSARYYNSIVAISSDGEITDAADKSHLVPFGEYLPLEAFFGRLGISRIVTAPGPFSTPADREAISIGKTVAALPLICYEIIFPGEAAKVAGPVNIIVNVTNDAWYGDTPGPYQHLRQAQVRAVEIGLPVVRAANNGISAVIDAHGRIEDALALNAVGNLDHTISLPALRKPSGRTQARNALVVISALLLAAALLSIAARLRAD